MVVNPIACLFVLMRLFFREKKTNIAAKHGFLVVKYNQNINNPGLNLYQQPKKKPPLRWQILSEPWSGPTLSVRNKVAHSKFVEVIAVIAFTPNTCKTIQVI